MAIDFIPDNQGTQNQPQKGGVQFTPNQSATILGHSTGLMKTQLQPGLSQQNVNDMGMGALKSIGDTAVGASRFGADFANQTAGRVVNAVQGKGFNPLSNEQLGANDIGNSQSQFNKNLDTNLASTNTAQGVGKFLGNVGQAMIPIDDVAKGGIAAESLVGKAAGAIKQGVGMLSDSSGLTKFLSDRAISKATSAVQSTTETMTKGERESAILEGRLQSGIGGGKYLPSDTEKQAGQILSGKMGGNPIKNVPVIQKEIAQRGKEAEQFLGMNGKPISNEENFNMFQSMKEKASKYLTPEQMKNYDHTINQFQGELKGMGNMNTGTYYKALKGFEQNVTARLRQGNEALLTDSGSAQLQAAKDVRTAVRNMIGEKNPEFKGKMFDLASLYDALDTTVTKASKADTFTKRFPMASKTLKYGLEAIGAGGLYEGAKKAGVPLPL